ncbi:AfsR/SARP family transcriptional regulator [Streptomyces albus subsp. chlorinus]|uniref:AfsR/SARP family transcriptional regulator n=1 Tax=Streptomyces albus TaxID=1888 RepID=UPI00156EBF3E|nr:AfsR/SARP family transcriptional regulator [Streptomyces albus]NSC21573.1 AfsR/SARP family transcriptional regulator [Streptomyces albus subsp. chlorinus]
MRFTLLGSVEAINGDHFCTPSAPKVRQVLALLLLRASRLVRVDSVIEELWCDSPPKSAMTTAQTYIYHLRKMLEREGVAEHGDEILQTQPFGYLLKLDPQTIDAWSFEKLAAEGQAELKAGRPEQAAAKLAQALKLWTGPPLGNVDCGPVLSAYAVQLEEQRLQVLQQRIEAELQLGREGELVGELRRLVAENPLNEWFHGRLIRALQAMGRRNEALQVYQKLRVTLSDEIGLSPSVELQRIHQGLLTDDKVLP